MEEIQKELKIRKRVTSIFEDDRDAFDSKDSWDAYLENVEDIIYNLTHGIDALEMENRIAEYERTKKSKLDKAAAQVGTVHCTVLEIACNTLFAAYAGLPKDRRWPETTCCIALYATLGPCWYLC